MTGFVSLVNQGLWGNKEDYFKQSVSRSGRCVSFKFMQWVRFLMILPLVIAVAFPAAPVQCAGELEVRLQELGKTVEQADRAAQDRASLAYLSNMPLARLKIRKAQAYADLCAKMARMRAAHQHRSGLASAMVVTA